MDLKNVTNSMLQDAFKEISKKSNAFKWFIKVPSENLTMRSKRFIFDKIERYFKNKEW